MIDIVLDKVVYFNYNINGKFGCKVPNRNVSRDYPEIVTLSQ